MLRVSLALVLTLLVPAGAHAAGNDGVTYDPDSPAGKEYALPIDSARHIGSGGGNGATGGSTGSTTAAGAVLFGAGVASHGAPKSNADGTEAKPGSGRSQSTSTKALQAAVTSPQLHNASSAEVVQAATGPSALTLGGAAIVLVGASALLLGLGYRRRRAPAE